MVATRPSDIRQLLQSSIAFSEQFEQARKNRPFDMPWYAYDSLGNLDHFDRLLSGRNRNLHSLAGGKPVLDIGCADGQLAFFLESQGMKMAVADNPGTNANTMLGVRELKSRLNSAVEIHEVDLDQGFTVPPPGKFGLTLLLGVLYHLQNPMYVLKQLSHHTRYCLLSTRIARFTPDGAQAIKDYPLAWLAGPDEVNSDCTNFWIFSETGLRRAIDRCGWRVAEFMTVGDTEKSDPVHGDRDERAFCLLESKRVLDYLDLLDGWFNVESAGWRWTAPEFGVRLNRASAFKLNLYIPEQTIDAFGSVTITCHSAGQQLASRTWKQSRIDSWSIPLPESAWHEGLDIYFRVDSPVPISNSDPRALGIIVSSAELL
ncbi:MAG TPA: methyltransferase domain-containing protein [Bryobacteraceae bacterium]|nr:methyltransferase domain-containing protein [Bryobacteraceae bacterium]